MPSPIRPSDASYASVLVPFIIAGIDKWGTSLPAFSAVIAMIPDWAFPAACGFAVTVYLIDPWRPKSRMVELWQLATNKFEIEHFCVQQGWYDLDTVTYQDLAVRLRVRFLKDVRQARMALRIYACTGMGRKPCHWVIALPKTDVAVAGRRFHMVDARPKRG